MTRTQEIDLLFSKYIKLKRKHCERCGKQHGVVLDCAHIFSRGIMHLRWDERNVFCLCRPCHSWGHRFPALFTEFAKEKLGQKPYSAMRLESYSYAEPPNFKTLRKFLITETSKLEKAY